MPGGRDHSVAPPADVTESERQLLLSARLKLVGSIRGDADAARVAKLQQRASALGIAGSVDWCVGVPHSTLRSLLGGAAVGLHTMTDEHFGIGIVEYMAAGAIVVAHASAGPLLDIVVPAARPGAAAAGSGAAAAGLPEVGFLAITAEEYASALAAALTMHKGQREAMAAAARRSACSRFSAEAFEEAFVAVMAPLLSVVS